MSATISVVESSNPAGLTTAARQLTGPLSELAGHIATQQHRLADVDADWDGTAATAAGARGDENLQRQRALEARLRSLQSTLSSAGTNLSMLKDEIGNMVAQVRSIGGVVAEDGTVQATGTNRMLTPALASAYSTSLHTLLGQFDAVDEATAQQLGGGDEQGEDTPSPAPAPQPDIDTLKPPEGATDTEVNQWWDSLSEADKQRLINEKPEWIGNLDGVPPTVRDKANRNRLDDLAKGDLNDKDRATLDAINKELFDENGNPIPDRQVLVVDFDGDNPKVALAVGNVETADNVSVFVPGTGAVPYDKPDAGNDLPTYMDQAEALKNQAEAVARLKDPDATVATIAWVGYDPPTNLGEAAKPGYSDNAAQPLASFINGIDSSRDTDPHLAVIGHSYGSLVASEALQRGTAADDVIFMGSPGLETNLLQYFSDPTPEKFHLTEVHVYVEHAKNDYIADIGRFGKTIVSDLPGFIDLSTNAESTPLGDKTESKGHSEYFNTDTTALYNQAVVVAGLGGDDTYIRKED